MNKTESEQLIAAAQRLVAKIDKIEASPEYEAVWVLSFNHGLPYSGENWEKELDELRALLQRMDE